MKFSVVPSRLYNHFPTFKGQWSEFVETTEAFKRSVRDYDNNTGFFSEKGVLKLASEPAHSIWFQDDWLMFEYEMIRGMNGAIPLAFDDVKPYVSIETFPYRRNNAISYSKVHLVYDGPEDLGLMWRLMI